MSINYELYDRQIRTYGENATLKITTSSVVCIGLEKGLSTEILKNLVLMGINKIYLLDNNSDNLVIETDLLTGYYYTIDDLNKKRHKILTKKLKELNSLLEIEYYKDFNKLIKEHNDINVVIIINDEYKTNTINSICHIHNIKIISLQCSGNNGLIFVDAGQDHLVTNITGEEYEPVHIISIDNNIISTNGHEFQTDDTILLKLENTNIENQEYKIKVINKYKFELLNFTKNFNFISGIIYYVDKPTIINHNRYIKNNNYNYIHYNYEIISVNSIIGSLVSSETIKLITNKYMPISQWFFWEDKNLINYDLSDTEIFVVGSGAIGCELLKNLAFLNVKKIILTDPDIIEKSNLSRQFLFREKDIGKLKSEIASLVIKKMKPNIKIEYYSEKVGDENILFTNNILKKSDNITCVFNALDNISARKFMDIQCFNNNLPLFESGTMGLKGNTQPIIPFITETYSNTTDPDNEKTYPVCTIKNFPNEIQHTIHWALDQFEFFNRGPTNLNLWLSNKNNVIPNIDVWLFTTKYNVKDWYSCALWAIDMFHDYFYNQIIKLLINFPYDSKTKEGTLFWSVDKKYPIPILLDEKNELHLDFIESTTILLCNCLNFKLDFNRSDIYIIIENNKQNNNQDNDLTDNIIINDNLNIKLAIPQIFEKDNDKNYHIKWITSSSNLRAINYSIEPISFYKTKGIAGKIIPAVATTTSIVAGLITIELLKYLSYKTNLNTCDKYNSTFINLATNLFVSAEPNKANILNIANQEFNEWYKFIEKENLTITKFIEKYNELFKINIDCIVIGNSIIYADFIQSNNDKVLSTIINSTDYILSITCTEDILLPDIIVQLL
jgi:ubiquitin-activating enzyme E1